MNLSESPLHAGRVMGLKKALEIVSDLELKRASGKDASMFGDYFMALEDVEEAIEAHLKELLR